MAHRKLIHSCSPFTPEREINTLPSLTVPDMALSLKNLLENYTRQGYIPPTPEYIFDEEDQFPNPATLDLTDYSDIGETAKVSLQKLREQQAKIADYEKKVASAKVKLALKAEIEAENKASLKQPSDNNL